jgi:hypothetical protein
MKIAVFWEVTRGSFVDEYQRFGGKFSLHLLPVSKIEVADSYENYTAPHPGRSYFKTPILRLAHLKPYLYIVACRPLAGQQRRDKQLYNSRC